MRSNPPIYREGPIANGRNGRRLQSACGLVAGLLLGGLAAGCGTASVETPVVQSLMASTRPSATDADAPPADAPPADAADVAMDADELDLEFWHQLAERPVTSYDDAFHALLLFADGQDPADDYAGRTTALKDKGWLPGGFERPSNQAVDRGTLAVALAKALDIRGGVVMSLFGPSPRYATKELEYLAVYPTSSPNQTFSGSEFLAVMSRVEEYQRQQTEKSATGGPAYVPPELGVRRDPIAPALPAPEQNPAVPQEP